MKSLATGLVLSETTPCVTMMPSGIDHLLRDNNEERVKIKQTRIGVSLCPQLQHREHYLEIGHKIYQTTTIESSRLRLSRSRPRVPETALDFGRDNRRVLESILGYGPERIADLSARGVLS